MTEVILDILKPDTVFEVEFLKEDATNYEFEGQLTFTISIEDILLDKE
jgi:hypothetical protein